MKLTGFARNHWHHHSRFYLSALLGILVWLGTGFLDRQLRLVLAGYVFFAAYLLSMAILTHRISLADMRRRSSIEDEGITLIMLITIAAIGFSLVSLFGIFNQKEQAGALLISLSVASVPLGWFTLHLIFAFRYAHRFYEKAKSGKGRDAGGLDFPGTEQPGGWDFAYYSFVVGTTAQVSDVDVSSTGMRKLTMTHSIIAFFYNTVLIALAVNIAVQNGN